ncbi:MATE family efflux transporter [Mollicutes bacterium LVI A0039]|nr:MATE family efflux transporter [Mollicutes bacterium LVI A0039]
MQEQILTGDLKKTMINLTIPGYIGMLGMNIFNIIDTYFVSIIGGYELAAMSFTFSIVMLVNLITIGLGAGIGALVSKAVGQGNEKDKVHIIMTGIAMSLALALTISVIGSLTIDPLFRALGADSNTLPLVKSYMVPWYLGCTFLFMSMVGGQIFRGLGDTKTPANLMILSAIINTILDPIMIFGLLSFPALGIAGASIATVISRMFTCTMFFYYLHKKYNVIHFQALDFRYMLGCAKRIFIIGVPNSLTKIVNPLIVTMITASLATQSQMAVAGYGVGTKIESFVVAIAVALGNTAMAVLGQNLGAGNKARAKEALAILNKFSVIIFSVLYIILFWGAPYFARIFTDSQEVIDIVVIYLRILPLSYPMQSMFMISTSFYNVQGKPWIATILGGLQLLVVAMPLGILGFKLFDVYGLFAAVLLSYYLVTLAALAVNKKLI